MNYAKHFAPGRWTRRWLSTRRDEAFRASMDDPREFWRVAANDIYWHKPFQHVLDTTKAPFYKWFVGGETNACYNAVDRNVAEHRGDQVAVVYESAITGERQALTYSQLLKEVETAAGMLRYHGVNAGDTVIIYMPMIPQTLISMLACARIGAIHSVVFGGFASNELAARINDAKPKIVLAGSAGMESTTKTVHYQPLLQQALKQAKHKVEKVIMLQRPQAPADVSSVEVARYFDWHEEMYRIQQKRLCADPVWVDSNHPLYIIYTSGSTSTPKGVLRDTAGYCVALKWSMKNVYAMNSGETWWAASDPAWVVGASYMCYGPLLNGNATVMFEGKPVGTPDAEAYWRVCREYNVKSMFTAPTALRAIKKEDPDGSFINKNGVGGLRTLFVAGERCDPDTVLWAERQLKIPVIDHYWQTEFGWPVLANCMGLGAFPVRPGSAGKCVPGWDVRVLSPNTEGESHTAEYFATHSGTSSEGKSSEVKPNSAGIGHRHHNRIHSAPFLPEAAANVMGPLVVRLPLPPGALTTLYNNDARFLKGYIDPHPGYFETGDAGFRDPDGYLHVMSRIDDVINVAGHRLSTGAMEASISAHASVAECAVVGAHDALKGQVPIALVVLKRGVTQPNHVIAAELIKRVRDEIGAVAVFKMVVMVPRLPKTRSGKVLRSTIRAIADGVAFTTPATIDDAGVLKEIHTALSAVGLGKGPLPPLP